MAPRKTKKLWVRLTWDQWTRLRRAARIESERRHEEVAPGTLLRELGMPGVEDILTPAESAHAPVERGPDRRTPALAGR